VSIESSAFWYLVNSFEVYACPVFIE